MTINKSCKLVELWLDNFEKGQNTYILLSLLYPNLKLSHVTFHQDHCHPFSKFDKKSLQELKLDDNKIKEWQKKRNLLPNLQFLEGSENESKNDTPLVDWVNEGNDFEYHPENVSLELKDFESFFDARRQLIKEELARIFEVELKQKNIN